MTSLTIEKLRAAMAALKRAEIIRDEQEACGPMPYMVGPRQHQDFLDVVHPSRRWARRYIRLSRREHLGLDRGQAYRTPAVRFRRGRNQAVRRFIRARIRRTPPLPSIF